MDKVAEHEALKPVSWLIGSWKSNEAIAFYPTIQTLSYEEEVEFTHMGQPVLNYNAVARNPISMKAMHLESGFLRIKPGTNKLAFMLAHNLGLTELSEGEVNDTVISLSSSSVSHMNFAKDPAVEAIQRKLYLENGILHSIVYMKTTNQPLQEHLKVQYQKIQ